MPRNEGNPQVHNFGDPFLFRIGADEPLRSVKRRVQQKLGVPDDEFGKWKWAYHSLGRTEYLEEEDRRGEQIREQESVWRVREVSRHRARGQEPSKDRREQQVRRLRSKIHQDQRMIGEPVARAVSVVFHALV